MQTQRPSGYLRVNDPISVPSGGWRFFAKETGALISASTLESLKQTVRTHYEHNKVPVPDRLGELVEAQMCSHFPEGCTWINGQHDENPMTVQHVLAGTQAILKWVTSGFQKVEPVEAERRAAICVSCPENRKPVGCSSCLKNAIHDTVNMLVKPGATQHDESLHGCAVCHCSLKAKVWFPMDILTKITSPEQNNKLPTWCWNKT